MQYLFLGAAIVLEIIATTLLKASAGFTKLLPGLGCVIFYALCFYLFSRALLNIDLGVAYATWCAGGIVATTIISALVFGQKINLIGIISIVFMVVGCVVLNLLGWAGLCGELLIRGRGGNCCSGPGRKMFSGKINPLKPPASAGRRSRRRWRRRQSKSRPR